MEQKKPMITPCLILGILGATALSADQHTSTPKSAGDSIPTSIPVDGRQNPEKVPDSTSYGMFVSLYERAFRDKLVQKLSPRDDAILNVLATEEERLNAIESDRYYNEMRQLCATRHGKDVEFLARESERIALAANNRRGARYREAVESLSPTGQQVVRDFVHSEITTRIKTSLPNTENYANANPDEFLADFDVACHIAETGDYPPEIKEALAKLKEGQQIETGPSQAIQSNGEN